MAAWFLVELNALIYGNLFCWKLSTCDLKFPGGRWPLKHMLSSPPSSLSSWLALCVFKDQCGEWHYKVSLPFYPFLFLDTEGKDPTRRVRRLGTKETTTFPNQWSPKRTQTLVRNVRWTPAMGQAWQRVWASLRAFSWLSSLFSRLLSTDCFYFCGYVIVMCSQGTSMFTT